MSIDSPAQSNKSIVDGFTVLQALASADRPMGGRELARLLDMEATKVNRLLKTLASMGILQQNAQRKYEPGSGMHVLAAQSLHASRLLHNAMGPLDTLTSTGLIVALGVLWRDQVAYIYHRTPGMAAAQALGRIGSRPASATGVGMVLLASNSDEELHSLYNDKDVPGFPTGIDGLLCEIEQVRRCGYARTKVQPDALGKLGDYHHTLAVTVGIPATAAIAVSGWIPDAATPELIDLLMTCKKTIEDNIQRGS